MAFLKKTAFSVAEYLTPVLTSSQFYRTGQLTPEEFIISGDQLVSKCTSWHWGTGAANTIKDFLPKEKQYLYTKGVPCAARASSVTGNVLDEQDTEDDWLLTTKHQDKTAHNNTETTTTESNDNQQQQEQQKQQQQQQQQQQPEEEEIPDLDDFDYGELGEEEAEEETVGDDSGAVVIAEADISSVNNSAGVPTTTTTATTNTPDYSVRVYDISVVYDKLYRCPRVFLQGYDAHGKPLTEQQIQQDISADHMNKTVTWELHPYTQLPCMSIHPCQHAHTMKRMLEIMQEEEVQLIKQEQQRLRENKKDGAEKHNVLSVIAQQDKSQNNNNNNTTHHHNNNDGELATIKQINDEAWKRVQERMTIDKSIFLFLKFVATVIPTIDYDNTINFDIF